MSRLAVSVTPRVGLALACLGIVVLQMAVLLGGDSRIFSGSDSGGRAAAVAAAAENGGCDHDLGYWAEEVDPAGRAHPMFNTVAVGGRFVQPATLPYVCLGASVHRSVGPPWAVLASVLGVLGAAVGAWMLERHCGRSGYLSLLATGVVGPVAFYGTDVWEHAPAVGAAVLGSALILARDGRMSASVAGIAWGLAIAMRVETGLVAIGLGLGVVLVAEVRRSLFRDRLRPALVVCGAAAVLVADRIAQQRLIGTDYRSGRAGTQAGNALDELADRGRDAVVTTFGVLPTDSDQVSLLFGVGLSLALFVLGAVVAGGAVSRRVVAAFAVVTMAVISLRVLDPGFVPGLFPAAPLAAAGVFVGFRRGSPPVLRVLCIGAMTALPLVWALQWKGNLAPQWGGRYSLLSGALLTIAGATTVSKRRVDAAGAALVVVAVLVGSMGLVWHVQRTHLLASVIDDVISVPCEEVIISTSPFLLREGGSFDEIRRGARDDGCRLLSTTLDDLDFALDVARDSELDRASVLLAGKVDDPSRVLRPSQVESLTEVDLGGLWFTIAVVEL